MANKCEKMLSLIDKKKFKMKYFSLITLVMLKSVIWS